MKNILIILCSLQLVVCAGPRPEISTVQVGSTVIENRAQVWVTAVRVLLPSTGAFVSCGNIAPDSMCSTSFPATAYTDEPLEVTWSQAGQIHSTGPFVMQAPADLDRERAVAVHVVITAPGSAGAVIVQ